MEAKLTCPLGHECERISNNVLERCAWYTCVEGIDDKGQKTSESKCAMAWLPQIQVRGIIATNGIQAAVESGRNVIIGLANGKSPAIENS